MKLKQKIDYLLFRPQLEFKYNRGVYKPIIIRDVDGDYDLPWKTDFGAFGSRDKTWNGAIDYCCKILKLYASRPKARYTPSPGPWGAGDWW